MKIRFLSDNEDKKELFIINLNFDAVPCKVCNTKYEEVQFRIHRSLKYLLINRISQLGGEYITVEYTRQ